MDTCGQSSWLEGFCPNPLTRVVTPLTQHAEVVSRKSTPFFTDAKHSIDDLLEKHPLSQEKGGEE